MIDKYLDLTINGYKALLQNEDIAAFEKLPKLTPAGLAILRHKGLKETQIQQSCVRMVKNYALTLKKDCKVKFIQIDNGGKLTDGGRIRKFQEGTYSNFCDAMIIVSKGKQNKVIFVEFKRIASKSGIVGKKNKRTGRYDHFEDQLKEIEDLQESGFSAYITNNTIFFENVILEEIKDFFKA
jgi:hypothetical protein